MEKQNKLASYALSEIEVDDVRDAFLGLMAIALVNGDVVGIAEALSVGDDHPVWKYVQAFLKEEFGIESKKMNLEIFRSLIKVMREPSRIIKFLSN